MGVKKWIIGSFTLFLLASGHGQFTSCPSTCRCGLDEYGRRYIRCTSGNMRSIPIDQMNNKAEIVVISSPDDERVNMLNIGPIFTQPNPFTRLEELHIVKSNVPSIGQFSFWGLQNLKVVNLTHNNISGIISDNFRGLVNLTDLYLDYNRIELMPSETFRHMPELRVLSLSNNRITTLVPRLFRMLAKLFYLNLSNNPLEDLNPEVFKDIQLLKVFKCRKCGLKRINTQIYHLITYLEELDLGENFFKYLTSDEFISLKKLKKIKIDGNQLPVILDDMFASQHLLHHLSLSRNRLALITPKAFTNLTRLKHLDISYNKLDRFHLQTFGPIIESLKSIDFSGNNLKLSEIAIVLQMLPDILSVGISNLSLIAIPSNLFSYNPHVLSLDISWNKLEVFPNKLLSRMRYLQKLDISMNQLQGLEEESLMRLEAIAQINLSGNPWNCEKCDIGAMLSYMKTTVLNHTIQELLCFTPKKLNGKTIGDIIDLPLDWCSSNSIQHSIRNGVMTEEGKISVIAGMLLIFSVIVTTVGAVICYSKRRSAEYYTNESKRRSNADKLMDNQLVYFCEHNEGQTRFSKDLSETNQTSIEMNNVATIHTPYQIISKGS